MQKLNVPFLSFLPFFVSEIKKSLYLYPRKLKHDSFNLIIMTDIVMRKKLFLLVACAVMTVCAYADSPLTTDVYRVAAQVVEDSSLKKDMKAEAVSDIWNYLKMYGQYE